MYDHSYTYTKKKITYLTHRRRYNEIRNLLKEYSQRPYETILDFGGAAGYLGDRLVEERAISSNEQFVYDIETPENQPNKSWYKPALKTQYFYLDLNSECLPDMQENSSSLIICSETLEHVSDPRVTFDKICDYARGINADLLVTVPCEHGFVGFAKMIARFMLLRNKNKTFEHNFLYFLKSCGLRGLKVRKNNSFYADHDGFESEKLLYHIRKNHPDVIYKRGASTLLFFFNSSGLNKKIC